MRRAVFYIPGFDPRGASYYHKLLKVEASSQAVVRKLTYQFSSRRRLSSRLHCWDIQTDSLNNKTNTSFFFCAWDDVVRTYWPRSVFALCLVVLHNLPLDYFSGRFYRVTKMSLTLLIGAVW